MSSKTEIERLVLWLVPALVLQYFSYFFADRYEPGVSTGIETAENASFVSFALRAMIAPMLIYLPNVVTGVWMWQTENAQGGRKLRWTLAALLLSYLVLIPYLGMYVLWRLEQTEGEPAD